MNSSNAGSDYKAQVLQATDIVEMIGQTVALKRRGKDYVGLCPFHQEKTPSFHVSPSKQYFYCYGCKASGNAIDFIIKRDRVEFIDALRTLGEKAGLEMPRYGVSKQKAGERQLLLEAQSAASVFFEKLLSHPVDGREARDYLAKRGFNADTLQRFQVGLAPNAWDGLLRSPLLKKFSPPLLASAGLLKTRENGSGFYDTFRNRLMFPIRDETARIIAFGGRVMPGSDDKAKYLNSPETPLFSKSRCAFGIDLARQRIVETRTVAVVEGYTDVMMAHQFGVSNVVSILGTALTEQHVSILRRFADRIVLLFDPDTAGDLAVNRSVELFLTQPVEILIATIPEHDDPDEYLLKYGAKAFEELLANATDALSYKWRQLERQFKSSSGDLTGQQKAVQEYLQMLASARGSGPVDPLRWGSALTRVSRLTEIPVDELNKRFKESPAHRHRGDAPVRESAESAPVDRSDLRATKAQDKVERWLLGALLLEPRRWHEVQQRIHVIDFCDEKRRRLAEIYWDHQRNEGEPVFNEFLGFLDEPGLKELAVSLIEEIEQLGEIDVKIQDAINYLAMERERQEEDKLKAKLRRTSDENVPVQDEEAWLKELTEKARRPDLRRNS